jgi:hypothetical protein
VDGPRVDGGVADGRAAVKWKAGVVSQRQSAIVSNLQKLGSFAQHDRRVVGAAEAACRRRDGLQHRQHVGRRLGDHPQHLGRRRLLFQGFAQLGGTVLDLLFEAGIGFLERLGRAVELIGQRFQLVARLDLEAVTEVAAAHALSPCLQGPDRHHHAPGQQGAGKPGNEQAQDEKRQGAQTGVDHRLLRLRQRQLDEHQPVQRRNRRIGGQDRRTGAIRGIDRGGLVARRYEGGRDLREAAHVRAAQHQRDVGMRHQPAHAVDDIGVAVLADLDLGDHVQDQLEIDLRDGDAAAAAMRHRHGEIGLALLAEIDRPEIDLVGLGLDEGRLGRTVGAAADHVHAEARHAELLAAVAVELHQLGDGRHLTQQTDIIEAPLFGRQRVELSVGHPADLVLDPAHEGFDPLRRRLGLLALHIDRGAAVFLVDEIEVKCRVDHQYAGHQAQEQDDVFQEQPALHSITSSARARIDGGMVRPSAFADPPASYRRAPSRQVRRLGEIDR